ncbi:MAG: hypothetical protein N2038_12415 [Geminicoccaceae bacterium]|nr:hypothetical protein [Geminicoccaceae bacterium]
MTEGLFVAVGTMDRGFDELVEAADAAAGALRLSGFAQIGGSRAIPARLAWARWLDPEEFRCRIARARVVITHGGIGILGDAMRARRPILAVPRRGRPSRSFPAEDQLPVLRRIAAVYPIHVCEDPRALLPALRALLRGPAEVEYRLGSDVPRIVARFLARADQARGDEPVGSIPRKR